MQTIVVTQQLKFSQNFAKPTMLFARNILRPRHKLVKIKLTGSRGLKKEVEPIVKGHFQGNS